jgi:hypothetical protein
MRKLHLNEVESVPSASKHHPFSLIPHQPFVWPAESPPLSWCASLVCVCSLRLQCQRDLIKPELRLFLIMDLYLCVATCMSLLDCERASSECVPTTNNETHSSQCADMKVSLMLFVSHRERARELLLG